LRWAIRIGRRRDALRPASLATYHARAERRLDALVATPAAHPAGRELQTRVKAWRTKFFVFLEDPEIPATNNACEREIRPSVVFRKVTGGFRSDWGLRSTPATAPSPAPPSSTAKPRCRP
jgi:transposase